MSNKTPPLVIPVVVDASGVQSGLNNVNKRLRQGVSGGSVATGTGGGFGSGGGGSVAASIVGAAVGTYGASGSGGGAQAPQSAFRSRMNAQPSWFRNATRGQTSYGPSFMRSQGFFARETFANYDPSVGETQAGIKAVHDQVAKAAAVREYKRAAATRAKFGRMVGRGVGAFDSALESGSNFMSGLQGIRKSILPIAGAVYLGKQAYNLADSIGSAGSDLSGLVGSTNYGRMRNVALREFDRPRNPSPIQSAILGGMKMTGGRETALERDAASIRKGVSGAFAVAGAAYELGMNDPLALLRLWFLSGPMGKIYEMAGGNLRDTVKTEIAYRNWKAAGN